MSANSLTPPLAALLAGLLVAVLVPVGLLPWLLPAVVGLPLVILEGRRGLPGWFALGLVFALVWQAWVLEKRPDPTLGRDRVVIGRIADLPESADGRQRFLLRVEAMAPVAGPIPRYLRLSVYADRLRVAAGERWELPVRLRRPRGFMNPVRFDYERWLAANHIDATGYVLDADAARRLDGPSGLHHWRARLSRAITLAAGDNQGSALLQGLITGDRRAFSDSTWEILRATGTSHLVAISGLHIGLVAGLGGLAGRLVWRHARVPGPRHRSALLMGLLAAGGYAALAGFAIPTRRALIMFSVLALGMLAARRVSPVRGLLLAAAMILLLDPAAAHAPGFWLSFTAVGLILAMVRSGLPRGPLAFLRLQLALTLGLAPLSALFFGAWSPGGFVANLLVIPVFSLVLVPGALLATLINAVFPAVGGPLLGLLGAVLDGLLVLGEGWVAIGPGLQQLHGPHWLAVLSAVLGAALLALPDGAPVRWLALPLFAPLLIAAPLAPPPGEARITWLEVGQGNAAVIQTATTVTVVDTGPGWRGGGNAARFTLLPYLEERGIRRVDRLIVTHGDLDHRGGVNALLDALSVSTVLVGEDIAEHPGARRCKAGMQYRVDGVLFRFLAPPAGQESSGNAASCVLLVETAGGRALFTGDIGGHSETAVARRLKGGVDLMEAPHHGSRNSAGLALLAAAAPRHVIVSAGYRNPYGMPHPETLGRLRCSGAHIHDVGLSGAIEARLGRAGVTVQPGWRWQHARVMNASPRAGRFQGGREIPYHPGLVMSQTDAAPCPLQPIPTSGTSTGH